MEDPKSQISDDTIIYKSRFLKYDVKLLHVNFSDQKTKLVLNLPDSLMNGCELFMNRSGAPMIMP